mmetsp:Transcript_6042/g.10256  ORF Transcript_6042/g.10256 Transcript_6042/m.10256 type:complete len:116 (-) Transcript_6042:123-470(-)
MDLNMPNVGGMDASRKIRELYETLIESFEWKSRDASSSDHDLYITQALMKMRRGPLICAVSASEFDPQLQQECKQAGMNLCFSSPIDSSDLKNQVINVIEQERQGLSTWFKQKNQ